MVSNKRIPQLPKQHSMACWKYQHLPVVFCGVSSTKNNHISFTETTIH